MQCNTYGGCIMKINNAANFTQIIVKLLKCLDYSDIKEVSEEGIDIIATKEFGHSNGI